MPALNPNLLALILFCAAGLFILALIIVAVILVARFAQTNTQAWRELALRTGLTAQRYSLDGSYRDHAVNIYYTGNRGLSYLHLDISVNNPAGVLFKLSQQYDGTLENKVQAATHTPDIKIGDEQLDHRFIIESQPEGFAEYLFESTDLRQKLLQTRPGFWVRLNQQLLEYSLQATVTDVNELQAILELMSAIAQAVDSFSG